MIEANQRMMTMNSQGEERVEGINPTLKRHLDLKIEKLQNPTRYTGQVKTAFESKAKEEGGGNEHRRHTKAGYRRDRNAKVVLCLVSRIDDRCLTTNNNYCRIGLDNVTID
jgi:hypothetical protein